MAGCLDIARGERQIGSERDVGRQRVVDARPDTRGEKGMKIGTMYDQLYTQSGTGMFCGVPSGFAITARAEGKQSGF